MRGLTPEYKTTAPNNNRNLPLPCGIKEELVSIFYFSLPITRRILDNNVENSGV